MAEEPPFREENGMRDAGSAAKKIFPELAQVSLLAGYKHREGLGQDEEWGGAGGWRVPFPRPHPVLSSP